MDTNTNEQHQSWPTHSPPSQLTSRPLSASEGPVASHLSGSTAVLIEPLESRLSGSRVEPQDEYRSMIRELLRFDSRLSSLSSSCSSHPFTGATATPSTASSVASTSIELEDGRKERESPTSVLLPEENLVPAVHVAECIKPNCNKRQSGLRDKAYDYSNRILRYVSPVKVLMVILLLGITLLLFYFLRVDLSQTKSLLCLVLVWCSLVGYYLCIPTFKRWFAYWESQ